MPSGFGCALACFVVTRLLKFLLVKRTLSELIGDVHRRWQVLIKPSILILSTSLLTLLILAHNRLVLTLVQDRTRASLQMQKLVCGNQHAGCGLVRCRRGPSTPGFSAFFNDLHGSVSVSLVSLSRPPVPRRTCQSCLQSPTYCLTVETRCMAACTTVLFQPRSPLVAAPESGVHRCGFFCLQILVLSRRLRRTHTRSACHCP